MPARRLNPEGGWTPGGVLARTLGPKVGGLGGHRLEKGTSVTGTKGGGL